MSAAIELLPAIDVRDGRAVRLLRGDYARETVYDGEPLDAARRWVDDGARSLHVVDLDGARAGAPRNLEALRRIVAGAGVPVQAGGGLRDARAVAEVLELGAERAILGTAAQRDPGLVARIAGAHGRERIVASVDARAGRIAVEGWEERTTTPVTGLVARLADAGIGRFVYTPVEVDGTLEGPGLEGLAAIADVCAEAGAELVYSGGVGSLADLEALASLAHPALSGVIVGRALYEKRFGVAAAIAALSGVPR